VASVSWIANFTTTIVVSLATRPKADEELKGLVYSLTAKKSLVEGPWFRSPLTLGILLLIVTILLNIIFF